LVKSGLLLPDDVFGIANEAEVWYTQYESRITDHASECCASEKCEQHMTCLKSQG